SRVEPSSRPEQVACHASVVDAHRPRAFDAAATRLVLEPLRARRARRLRRLARLALDERAIDELLQASQRRFPVLLLTTELLRLDDDDARGADAVVAQREQAILALLRQDTRSRDVELELDGRRNLVDVLAACTLRADRAPLDLVVGNLDVAAGAHTLSAASPRRAASRAPRSRCA